MVKNVSCVPLLLGLIGLGVQVGCGGGNSSSTTVATGPLTVRATIPGEGQEGVATDSAISVLFSNAMNFSTVNVGSFLVTDPNGNPVPGSFDYSTPLTATFLPANGLQNGTTYTVSLTKTVTSVAGKHLKLSPFQFSFTTQGGEEDAALAPAGSYPYSTSTTPGGPAFSYQDISATGTALNFTTPASGPYVGGGAALDDGYAVLPAPFPIYFYNQQVTALNVSTNGFVTAGVADTTSVNYPFPAATHAVIAPYFTDLTAVPDPIANPGAGVLYQVTGTAPNRQLVIQWHDVSLYGGSGTGDFELILYESSRNILFQYQSVSGLTPANATIGLNLGDGILASQVSYNTGSAADGMAILFTGSGPVAPADGATGVPATTGISATFTQPMLGSSLQGAFTVTPTGGGNPVPGTVTLDPSGTTATFQPASSLAFSTSYTVTISTAAQSAGSKPLATPVTWAFTTGAPTQLTYTGLGQGKPPALLGTYGLSGFATDASAIGTVLTQVDTSVPDAPLEFVPGLTHLAVGQGWAGGWGQTYAGSIYFLEGGTSAVLILPPNTGAFCLYLQPNDTTQAYPCTVTATTENGYQSQQTQSIQGPGGALGFAFAATGSPLGTIAISVPAAANGFAVGEFRIGFP